MTPREASVSTSGSGPAPHPPHREGSRSHVKWYRGSYRGGSIVGEIHCSEPRCELNEEATRPTAEHPSPVTPQTACARCDLPVESAIHWPGMVPESHPFVARPVEEERNGG